MVAPGLALASAAVVPELALAAAALVPAALERWLAAPLG